MFRFEKFDVWHKAVDFANKVYSVTAGFPSDERFGLTSQIRRAAVSISSNIAEGSSRSSDADFARFLEISYGSLMESVSQAMISRKQSFLSNEHYDELHRDAEELAKMLSGKGKNEQVTFRANRPCLASSPSPGSPLSPLRSPPT